MGGHLEGNWQSSLMVYVKLIACWKGYGSGLFELTFAGRCKFNSQNERNVWALHFVHKLFEMLLEFCGGRNYSKPYVAN